MISCQDNKALVYGFGFNVFGQITGGTNQGEDVVESPIPVRVKDAEKVIKIEASWSCTFFVKEDGSVDVIGVIPNSDSIVDIKTSLLPDKLCKDFSCGWNSAVLLTHSGECLAWKDFNVGVEKAALLNIDQKLVKVSVGDEHTIAISDKKQAFSVNPTSDGGNLMMLCTSISPSLKVDAASCGKEHVIILSAGSVFSYGGGSRGQLGHGLTDAETEPRRLEVLVGINIKCIAAGGWHSAVISDAGDVYGWGWNESGQVGIGDGIQCQMDPTPICFPASDEPNVVSVACGARHTAAVSDDAQVWTWGWGRKQKQKEELNKYVIFSIRRGVFCTECLIG
ncbi:RCC1 domain-containing protein 1 isoform X2 [Nematostella vectensis]|uniref:RCC1 domain-containing protein 1 isoform X2 n=1 Tax=Nematostella vectensis TaxID=45351 RepID=UPI00207795AE|nr:RCC1 domain-containing protein 1 isoform X2 [Nematostella vectensis]